MWMQHQTLLKISLEQQGNTALQFIVKKLGIWRIILLYIGSQLWSVGKESVIERFDGIERKWKWNSWRLLKEYILFFALFLHLVSRNLSICIYSSRKNFSSSTLTRWKTLLKSVNLFHDSAKSIPIPNFIQTLYWLKPCLKHYQHFQIFKFPW